MAQVKTDYRSRTFTYRRPYYRKRSSTYRYSNYRKGYFRYSPYSGRAAAVKKLAAVVSKEISQPAMAPPKKMTVHSDQIRMSLWQHTKWDCLMLPVTWAIPRERPSDLSADDRFRTSNSVYLTGVRVRFTLHYDAPVRYRLACFKVGSAAERGAYFLPVRVDGVPVEPNTAFRSWWTSFDSHLPLTPYASVNYKRQPPLAPLWTISSPDGKPQNADLAKNDYRPIKTTSWGSSVSGDKESRYREEDWYCPIGVTQNFLYECDKLAADSEWRIMFTYDTPTMRTKPDVDDQQEVVDDDHYAEVADRVVGREVGVISGIQITVYYR